MSCPTMDALLSDEKRFRAETMEFQHGSEYIDDYAERAREARAQQSIHQEFCSECQGLAVAQAERKVLLDVIQHLMIGGAHKNCKLCDETRALLAEPKEKEHAPNTR